MNRKSFIRRLLGLAAATVAAPAAVQALVKEVDQPGIGGTTFKYRNLGLETLSGKRPTPVRGNVLLHTSGKEFYVCATDASGIQVCDIFCQSETFIIAHEQIGPEYMVICSVIPEGR
jgi:hypothetical protein